MRSSLFTIIALSVFILFTYSHETRMVKDEWLDEPLSVAAIYDSASVWVDSVYSSLSNREKIAQLFWLTVDPVDDRLAYNKIRDLIEDYQPGGVLFLSIKAERLVEAINDLQSVSKLPLLVSLDAEHGVAMRIKEAVEFPRAMTLGAIRNDTLIYEMGLEIARQFAILGLHVNMAPVADVNNNPANPVIGMRSFGEDPANVSRKSVAYMQGLQDGGIMAVGKHFPGHGDTDTDSHLALPLVNHSREQLDSADLVPFRALIEAGIWGIMTAHIEVPALESKKGVPASFSDKVVEGLLRDELGFEGLIITDAVNMQGAKVMGKAGEIDAKALIAGNDIVEFSENLPAAIAAVESAISDSLISWRDIERKCRRSLAFKYWLIERRVETDVDADKLVKSINSDEALSLNQRLYNSAVTVLKNEDAFFSMSEIPVNYASVILGQAPELEAYYRNKDIPVYILPLNDNQAFMASIERLSQYVGYVVVVADSNWGRRAVNSSARSMLAKLLGKENSLFVYLGMPYHLSAWKEAKNARGVVMSYQNNEAARQAIVSFLSREIGADGLLPVTINGWYPAGSGIVVEYK